MYCQGKGVTQEVFRNIVLPLSLDFVDILDARSRKWSELKGHNQFKSAHVPEWERRVDDVILAEREDDMLKGEKMTILGNVMSTFVIFMKHQIEFRRQYLKDIRFIEGAIPHRGSKATGNDFDDLLHFEKDFIGYVKENHYPFVNEFYKIKAGATIKR